MFGNNKTYWDVNKLSNWEKNNDTRILTEKNHLKLKASIQRHGIKKSFEIDEQGIVYDGNNRLKILKELLSELVTKSESGRDLTQVPVIVNNPQTESEKWDLALSGNSQYATWNKETLPNYLPEFENDLDLSLYNVDFTDQFSIDEQLENEGEEKPSFTPREIECPSCGNRFTPKNKKSLQDPT